MRAKLRLVLSTVVVLCGAAAAVAPAPAATGGSTVAVTVVGGVSLDTTNCTTGQASRTVFAPLLPSQAATTGLDCSVQFGSSSDTSMLRVFQQDAGGVAMRAGPATNVVGHWPLNGSGADLAVPANPASLNIAPADATYIASRADLGQALAFDSDDWASAPSSPAYDLDVFTVDLWFRSTGVPNGTFPRLVAREATATNRNFSMHFDTFNCPVTPCLATSISFGGLQLDQVTDATPFLDGQWHHAAMVVGGSSMRLYVDGVEAFSQPFAGNVDNPAQPVLIGANYTGDIDEVRIHDVARTASEVRSYYLGTVADYANTGAAGDRDWSSAATTNMFGACLRSLANGASIDGGTWGADTVDADCADGDADPWRAVPATSAAGAKVAFAGAGVTNAQANFRFGFRTSSSQPAGTYTAPLTFEAVAPNV